ETGHSRYGCRARSMHDHHRQALRQLVDKTWNRIVADGDDVQRDTGIQLSDVSDGVCPEPLGKRAGMFLRTAIDLDDSMPSLGKRLAEIRGHITATENRYVHA